MTSRITGGPRVFDIPICCRPCKSQHCHWPNRRSKSSNESIARISAAWSSRSPADSQKSRSAFIVAITDSRTSSRPSLRVCSSANLTRICRDAKNGCQPPNRPTLATLTTSRTEYSHSSESIKRSREKYPFVSAASPHVSRSRSSRCTKIVGPLNASTGKVSSATTG